MGARVEGPGQQARWQGTASKSLAESFGGCAGDWCRMSPASLCCYSQTVTVLGTTVFGRVFQGALRIDVQKWICCFKDRVFTF